MDSSVQNARLFKLAILSISLVLTVTTAVSTALPAMITAFKQYPSGDAHNVTNHFTTYYRVGQFMDCQTHWCASRNLDWFSISTAGGLGTSLCDTISGDFYLSSLAGRWRRAV